MSRIGKKSIKIPEGVQVEIKGNIVKTKGPKGELVQEIPDGILVEEKGKELTVKIKNENKSKKSSAFWGLTKVLLENNILGVSKGFEKRLEIQGVGFKVSIEGDKLKLELGFSHQPEIEIPESLAVKVEKNIIIVSGPSKEKVGQFSANIRKLKPPEPYKGKGIRYLGENVRRKEGKKAGATTAAA